MNRLFSMLLSVLAMMMLFSATAGSAATFRATLVQAPDERGVIVRSAPWRCDGNACMSTEVRSRPAIACGAVARELGPIAAFAVDAATFTDEELAECNEYARD